MVDAHRVVVASRHQGGTIRREGDACDRGAMLQHPDCLGALGLHLAHIPDAGPAIRGAGRQVVAIARVELHLRYLSHMAEEYVSVVSEHH